MFMPWTLTMLNSLTDFHVFVLLDQSNPHYLTQYAMAKEFSDFMKQNDLIDLVEIF